MKLDPFLVLSQAPRQVWAILALILQPELAQRLSVALGFSLLFGLVSGAFLGRALNILARART